MSENTEIRIVEQPIFKQVVGLPDRINLSSIIKKHNGDYYYKAFKAKAQLVTMLFGIMGRGRCDPMTWICEGLWALGGKLNHLGLNKAPAKSTACDGLRNCDSRFFENVYFSLVHHYQSFLSDSRTFGPTFKDVLLIDTTNSCPRA